MEDSPELREALKFTDPHQPGTRCKDGCNHPDNVPWQQDKIYHPAGRNEHESG